MSGTCVVTPVAEEVDSVCWVLRSHSPVKILATDPMLEEACICATPKAAAVRPAPVQSIDRDPWCYQVSGGVHRGSAPLLHKEDELLMGHCKRL
jgi:hypothetical protein